MQINHVFDGNRSELLLLLLLATVKITLHSSAVWSRLRPQFDGYGNWPHFA